ncbi:hypothetical protein [Bradyrhizobium frederickii]|uniref:hypothetical protein n=1 Tax=Bradyrhizobium frederickii TaxID=2560054 RepID=UPI001F16DD23|nr:hypothetical protein [Bradyrhizobium frederickii]
MLMILGELRFSRGFPIKCGHFRLSWMEYPTLVARMTMECSRPGNSFWRRCQSEATGRLEIEKPLAHFPNTPLVKQPLLDTLAYEEPYSPCFCALLRTKVEEACLRGSILIIAVELAEWVVGVAAVGIDEPEMGLPENGS